MTKTLANAKRIVERDYFDQIDLEITLPGTKVAYHVAQLEEFSKGNVHPVFEAIRGTIETLTADFAESITSYASFKKFHITPFQEATESSPILRALSIGSDHDEKLEFVLNCLPINSNLEFRSIAKANMNPERPLAAMLGACLGSNRPLSKELTDLFRLKCYKTYRDNHADMVSGIAKIIARDKLQRVMEYNPRNTNWKKDLYEDVAEVLGSISGDDILQLSARDLAPSVSQSIHNDIVDSFKMLVHEKNEVNKDLYIMITRLNIKQQKIEDRLKEERVNSFRAYIMHTASDLYPIKAKTPLEIIGVLKKFSLKIKGFADTRNDSVSEEAELGETVHKESKSDEIKTKLDEGDPDTIAYVRALDSLLSKIILALKTYRVLSLSDLRSFEDRTFASSQRLINTVILKEEQENLYFDCLQNINQRLDVRFNMDTIVKSWLEDYRNNIFGDEIIAGFLNTQEVDPVQSIARFIDKKVEHFALEATKELSFSLSEETQKKLTMVGKIDTSAIRVRKYASVGVKLLNVAKTITGACTVGITSLFASDAKDFILALSEADPSKDGILKSVEKVIDKSGAETGLKNLSEKYIRSDWAKARVKLIELFNKKYNFANHDEVYKEAIKEHLNEVLVEVLNSLKNEIAGQLEKAA